MSQSSEWQKLCHISELKESVCAKGFDLDPNNEDKRFFVVKKRNRYFVYRNRCPHALAPLNWQQDQFLSYDKEYIQCSLHGALFRIEDGVCVAGPCPGMALSSVDFTLREDAVWFDPK